MSAVPAAGGSAILRLLYHAGGAGATLAIAWAAYAAALLPVHQQCAEAAAQISRWKALQARESEIRLQLAEAEESLARQEATSKSLIRVPELLEIDTVQANLATLARSCRMEITGTDVTEPVTADAWIAAEIHIRATADYAGLCRFLDGVQTQPRLCPVTRLHVKKRLLESDVLEAELTVRVFAAPLMNAEVEGTRRE